VTNSLRRPATCDPEQAEPAGSAPPRSPAVRRATLSDLEGGKAALSPKMALRIEKAFGVSMDTPPAHAGLARQPHHALARRRDRRQALRACVIRDASAKLASLLKTTAGLSSRPTGSRHHTTCGRVTRHLPFQQSRHAVTQDRPESGTLATAWHPPTPFHSKSRDTTYRSSTTYPDSTMARYDFRLLSDRDFEELCRDLLQAKHGCFVQSFKSGRDGGIDLRFTMLGSDTIVQCKHYVGSGFRPLKRHLRRYELEKIAKLRPKRYLLLTSAPLSPDNKRQLQEVLSPFIRSDEDIYGEDDLNNLLGLYPSIERNHFKLWLSSTNVLSSVLHFDIVNATSVTIEQIRRKIQRFVENRSLPDACEILERGRVLIISGAPGVGKTTLAEMILMRYYASGFHPIRLSYDLKEGFSVFRADERQIFFFDDFLGQARMSTEIVGRTDARIKAFVQMVNSSASARLIMTTREYILRQAQMMSEKLSGEEIDYAKFELSVGIYTKLIKAKILYNHIYFSNIDNDYKREIVRDQFYRHVIEHENFHPRLVEWISDLGHLKGITVDQYQEFVRSMLKRPERLWAHAFYRQISTPARHLLITLAFLPDRIDLERAEAVFQAFHQVASSRFGSEWAPYDFMDALKELEGSFVYIQQQGIQFQNPSVRGFLEAEARKNKHYVILLIESSASIFQFRAVWALVRENYRPQGEDALDLTRKLGESAARLFAEPRLQNERLGIGRYPAHIRVSRSQCIVMLLEMIQRNHRHRTTEIVCELIDIVIAKNDGDWQGILNVIQALMELSANEGAELRGKIGDIKAMMLDNGLEDIYDIEGFDKVWDLIQESPDYFDDADGEKFAVKLQNYLDNASDDELDQLESLDQIADYEYYVARLAKATGTDASWALSAASARREALEEREQDYDPGPPTIPHRPTVAIGTAAEERLIDDMFEDLGRR
jgi:DNA polymerase III delta prime subunit